MPAPTYTGARNDSFRRECYFGRRLPPHGDTFFRSSCPACFPSPPPPLPSRASAPSPSQASRRKTPPSPCPRPWRLLRPSQLRRPRRNLRTPLKSGARSPHRSRSRSPPRERRDGSAAHIFADPPQSKVGPALRPVRDRARMRRSGVPPYRRHDVCSEASACAPQTPSSTGIVDAPPLRPFRRRHVHHHRRRR
jgi:hypothetical protein